MLLSILIPACSPERGAETAGGDGRAVVIGPSLVELFFEGGIMDRVAAVDDYTLWPPEAAGLPRIGGYLDPSPEAIASLSATSIHSVGNSPRLAEISRNLGIPYHHYNFDTLDDVMAVCDSLEALYPDASFDPFRERLDRAFLENTVEGGGTAALVVFHGEDGRFTLAGRGTFYEDLLHGIGCSLAAPSTGTYPDVSVEGILMLCPDVLIFLAPELDDPSGLLDEQGDFWEARGFPRERVFVLEGDCMMIPGARLPEMAERLSACLNSR